MKWWQYQRKTAATSIHSSEQTFHSSENVHIMLLFSMIHNRLCNRPCCGTWAVLALLSRQESFQSFPSMQAVPKQFSTGSVGFMASTKVSILAWMESESLVAFWHSLASRNCVDFHDFSKFSFRTQVVVDVGGVPLTLQSIWPWCCSNLRDERISCHLWIDSSKARCGLNLPVIGSKEWSDGGD